MVRFFLGEKGGVGAVRGSRCGEAGWCCTVPRSPHRLDSRVEEMTSSLVALVLVFFWEKAGSARHGDRLTKELRVACSVLGSQTPDD